MSELYWLTDEQMARLQRYFPKSHGRPRVDDRRVLSGIVFVNRNGLRWSDAPREYGPHKTLYNRWKRWGERGVFLRMMEGLAAASATPKTIMIDATYLKAHRTASSLRVKKGVSGGSSVVPSQPLNLTCGGGGTANKASSSTAWIGGQSINIVSQRHQGFEDQVDIRLFSGDDRIRLPRTMLPPMHGGDGGWFRMKNVQADARSIRASVMVNFINKPKVYIDRVTGLISISGKAGDFTGHCQAVAADAPAKF